MTQPSNSLTKFIQRLTVAGVAVTGKTISDFTVTAYYKTASGSPTTYTHGSTLTELSGGWYAWTYSVPSSASHYGVDIIPSSGTDYLRFAGISGELENQDLDSIYAANARPISSLTSSGTIGQTVSLSLVAHRYRILVFSFVDSNGAAIDMTDGVNYTNIKFGVRAASTQAAGTTYDAAHGTATAGFTWSVVGASGTVTVKIPEDAVFFALMTEGATVVDSVSARYELTADVVSPVGETIALVPSSALVLTRREVGTT